MFYYQDTTRKHQTYLSGSSSDIFTDPTVCSLGAVPTAPARIDGMPCKKYSNIGIGWMKKLFPKPAFSTLLC